jgi:hypothetical protein
MQSILKLHLIIFFVIGSQAITACDDTVHSLTTQHLTQPGEIIATFTADGYTLSLATNCQTAVPKCPFRAEISGSASRFDLIEKVDYTFIPDRSKSPAPITDASTRFRFEAEQTAGEKVYAAVTLKPHDGTPAKVVQIEGTIPFAVEVTPPLPPGLRFEIIYRPWYLEGIPHEPVEYLFKIQLLGESAALKSVKSVEYRLPDDESKRPVISRRVESEYYVEGRMPKKEGVLMVVVIRWKNGQSSTHIIPLRPRL